MNRRSFLLGLLAAPLARLLPKVAPLPDVRQVARLADIEPANLEGPPWSSDQVSIWLINWGYEKPREFTGPYAKWERRMWMKGRIS